MNAPLLRISEIASIFISVSIPSVEAYHMIAPCLEAFYFIRAQAISIFFAHFLLFITILAIAFSFSIAAQI